MDVPIATANWLPVLIQQAADGLTAMTGVPFNDPGLSVLYSKQGGEVAVKALTSSNWVEHGAGVYKVLFTASEQDTLGLFAYTLQYTGARNYPGAVRIYVPAAGEGAVVWNYTVSESGTGDPIADVEVWLTADVDGQTMVAGPQRTSTSGQTTWRLDSGTYYVWCQKAGYNFTNPDIETVS